MQKLKEQNLNLMNLPPDLPILLGLQSRQNLEEKEVTLGGKYLRKDLS